MTRVRSACRASTCRSNISLTWSSQSAGTLVGRVRSGSGESAACFSASWMRRSTSRTVPTYSSTRTRSACPTRRCSFAMSSSTQSRMLAFFFISARRCSAVPPSPKSRSKTTRGSASVGRGEVGDAHDRLFWYTQA